MVRKLVIAVAAASALLSGNMAHALGVGDINLRSALNQPLDAEIQLRQVRDLESAEIISRLASPDDFGRAGIERPFFLTDLTFTPVIDSDGRAFIRVTSSQPVREPFVNFLLEVRWPSGRVLREFTLLIDPPTYQARPVTAPAVTPPAASASTPAPTTRTEQPAARPSTPATRPAPSAPRPADPAGVVTVGQNDTLWVLAQRNRPQNASVHQTMLAIQDLNPDAFIDNNINRLRSGQRLQMPDTEQATQRSQSQAVAAVARQNEDWQSARQTASQRQIDARQRDTAAPAPAAVDNGDTLRLVAGSDESARTATDSADGADQGALRDQLDQAKEQLDAAEREKAEMGERLSDVQGQLATLQRLLELKDAQLAALQREVGSTPEMPDILPEAGAELADVEAEARELDLTALQTLDDPIATTSELDVASDEMTAVESAVEEEQTPAAAAPAADSTDVVAAEEPATPAPEAAAPTQDTGVDAMLQRLLQNPALLYTGAGLALIVLLLILMALSRRNARREEEMADNFIAQASREHVTDAEQEDDFNVALADYDETTAGDEEDALVAAEGQIAYGKLDEARDTLIKALQEQPERTDLRLKLMEVEALRENAAGYAEQATTLRAEGGNESSLNVLDRRFPAVAAAAAALAGAGAVAADTENELADIDFLESDDSADTDKLDAEFDLADLAGEDELANLADSGDSGKPDDLDLDFDLDEGLGDELSRTEPDAEMAGLDLEADDLAAEIDSSQATDDRKNQDAGLDDDFDLSLTEDLQSADSETANKDADDLSLLDDDLMLDWSLDDESVSDAGTPASAPETLETARADDADADFSLSDDELLDFESEFNAAMAEDDASVSLDAEQTAESEADALEATPEQPVAADTEVTKEQPADMDDDDFDFLSGTDETATKLDLARAYVEMGDQEGARDILNEVVDEGNEQQQQEARGLLEQLDS